MKLVVNSDSLVSVADAIRTKGGTSEELEFPQGFVDGINAIESGGGEVPSKGFVPTEWDSNGFVAKGTAYNMTEIPNSFFQNRNTTEGQFCKMTNLDFNGNTPTKIGTRAFYHCDKLNFSMPDTVTDVLGYAFQYCYNFRVGDFSKNLVTIGESAFQGCKSSAVVTLPSTLQIVGKQAFAQCELSTVVFLGKPLSVDNSAFQINSALLNIYVPWAEGEVANAPWGATNATIHYNTTYDENGNPIVTEV